MRLKKNLLKGKNPKEDLIVSGDTMKKKRLRETGIPTSITEKKTS